MPANAKAVEPTWYTPYYNQVASLELPTDDQVGKQFSFKGTVGANYQAVLVKVVKDNNEVYYNYPVKNSQVEGKVYLRFGQGSYQVTFNLVKPNANPDLIKFEALAVIELENQTIEDQRYLLPSWGIESDNPEIIQKAQEITKGIKGDYQKAQAIYGWVSKNIAYDVVKYQLNQVYDNEGAVKALKTKKGLCRDYANLVTALLRATGIEAKTVLGQAGTAGNLYGHAWNEAKVNGRWLTMDATWDAGTIKNNKFIQKSTKKYFDLSAQIFGASHQKTTDLF